MSENCPKCGSKLTPGKNPGSKTCPNGSTWAANGNVRFASRKCAEIERVRQYDQIAALTQRLEQATAYLNTVHAHVKEALELLGVDVSVAGYIPDSWTLREQCHLAGKRLTAAESREKRQREGIEWLEIDIRTADSLNAGSKMDEWEAFCTALLAQPSDDHPGANSQPTHK